jgi:hypothetical protein
MINKVIYNMVTLSVVEEQQLDSLTFTCGRNNQA